MQQSFRISIIKFHCKHIIIDNDGCVASTFNKVFRLWGTDTLFLFIFSQHEVSTFWQFYVNITRTFYMSPNMTIFTKMKWFLPKLARIWLPKLMSKIIMFNGYIYRIHCFKNISSNYQQNIAGKAKATSFCATV